MLFRCCYYCCVFVGGFPNTLELWVTGLHASILPIPTGLGMKIIIIIQNTSNFSILCASGHLINQANPKSTYRIPIYFIMINDQNTLLYVRRKDRQMSFGKSFSDWHQLLSITKYLYMMMPVLRHHIENFAHYRFYKKSILILESL